MHDACPCRTGGGASIEALFDGAIDEIALIVTNRTRGRIDISEASFRNLIVHIAIAIERMRSGRYVSMDSTDMDVVCAGNTYDIACDIAEELNAHFNVSFPKSEIAYISIHLAGKQFVGDVAAGGLVISDEIWHVVAKMLQVIWDLFRIDLRNDIDLRFNLARHIIPLATRLRFNLIVENPLLDDVKKRFPLAFAMATEASSVLVEEYRRELSEDEVGYIALAFALALERDVNSQARKNILLVCASGAGSARLLEYRCREEFGQYLNKIIHCDVGQLSTIDFHDIDYVFTTVPIDMQLNVPVLQISVFLDDFDIRGIRKAFDRRNPRSQLRPYFKEELFVPHLSTQTKEETLELLCERMMTAEGLPDEYRRLVFDRERVAPTAFGDVVAIPHPIRPFGSVTRVAVGLLDRPVEWNSHAVKVVFLLSIHEGDHESLEGFYSGMVDLISDARAMRMLSESQKWMTLIESLD